MGRGRFTHACLALIALLSCAHARATVDLSSLRLPPGFRIALYAEDLPSARQLALGARGTLFVGSRRGGKVYAAVDADGDGRAERVSNVAEGLTMPTGVAFRDGALYVAAIDRVLRYDAIEAHLDRPPAPTLLTDALPDDMHHGWKYIAFGPDGKLYVPVGAPCNICEVPFPYGRLLRLPADGRGEFEVVAEGIRNTVGFDWHPESGELWFGDNGRDMLGDDEPPCELNRITRTGQHFGYPYVHGGEILDPEFGAGHRIDEFTAPAQKLGAHVAPVGVHFYRGQQFPESYRGALFVAEHGSWNRAEKSGYRVMVAHIDAGGRVARYEPFITGWLQGEEAWGRPVAFATLPDGSLLLSDDEAGVVYRISYEGAR
ncbi:MAG: PQQ-dependent sugar dehydrogenase [Gammaproteobacteria bacterium]|nr:PQQ-dependent sugar dehydrogenase [Gammaproteobacteria bacterium]